MLTVDFSYYAEQYVGTRIPAEEWPNFSRDASAYVDAITFGRITDDLPEDIMERCRMAICAVAEQDFRQSQGGEVASETLGRWSQTYVTTGQSAEYRRYECARVYLANTGLLHQEVGV